MNTTKSSNTPFKIPNTKPSNTQVILICYNYKDVNINLFSSKNDYKLEVEIKHLIS